MFTHLIYFIVGNKYSAIKISIARSYASFPINGSNQIVYLSRSRFQSRLLDVLFFRGQSIRPMNAGLLVSSVQMHQMFARVLQIAKIELMSVC
uniref:Ovule protein n=1 Tax=Steinernema glaseri TaxID=37863 RepID=A0A1I8A7V1_9BILA